MNSPDRARNALAGKEMATSAGAVAKGNSGWHQFVRRSAFAFVIATAAASTAVAAAVTSRFHADTARVVLIKLAKVILSKTLLFFADVGVYFKHGIDVMGKFEAAEFVQCVIDKTGYFDEAGFFHPALSKTMILALGAVQITVLVILLVGPMCLQKFRGKTLAATARFSEEKAI